MTQQPRILVSSALRALVLAAGLALLPGLAEARQTSFGGGGNDTIGSLPSHKGPGSQPHGNAGQATGQTVIDLPRLVLTGKLGELQRMLVDATGSGWVQVEELDELGTVRLTFHGDVVLTFDRRQLQASFAAARVEVAAAFAGGVATFSLGGEPVATQPLAPGVLDLRVQQALKAGLLDRGLGLAIHAPQSAVPQGRFDLRSNADLLRIVQTH